MKFMQAASKLPQVEEIPLPCIVSGKLDGIGVTVFGNELVVARSCLDLPNVHTQKALSYSALEGLHGEVTLANDPHNFNANSSAFMSRDGTPDFVLNVFDDWTNPNTKAALRKELANTRARQLAALGYKVKPVEQHYCSTTQEVFAWYQHYLDQGYEGIIICRADGKYKNGRSTLIQGLALKLKPQEDTEAEVIGFEELMRNSDAGNSQMKANMIPGGMLGALVCKLPNGVRFNIGTGFTEAQRIDIWKRRAFLEGALVTFKYMHFFKATGVPRGPVFKGFRSRADT